MFNFFKKRPVIQKTKSDILFDLQKNIDKYPKNNNRFHYRQVRASYISYFLNNEISNYNFSQPAQKEDILKKIVLEIYIHYLSINYKYRSSTLGENLKKSLTAILDIKKDVNNYELELSVKKFTGIDTKPLLFNAKQLSIEEEKKSSGSLFDSKGKSHNEIRFLCINAHKAIDALVNTAKGFYRVYGNT